MLLQIHLHVEPASQNTAGRWQIAHNPDCKKHHRVTRSRPQVGPCALGGKCPKERFPHPGSPFASSQGQAGAEREARRGERQAGRSLAQRSRPLPAALIPRRVAAAGWRALAGGTEGRTTWGWSVIWATTGRVCRTEPRSATDAQLLTRAKGGSGVCRGTLTLPCSQWARLCLHGSGRA